MYLSQPSSEISLCSIEYLEGMETSEIPELIRRTTKATRAMQDGDRE
jgi:hypothetical protein